MQIIHSCLMYALKKKCTACTAVVKVSIRQLQLNSFKNVDGLVSEKPRYGRRTNLN